jgi:hypothetical protein
MSALVRLNPTGLRRFLRCEYESYAYRELGIYKQQTVPSVHRDRGKVFHALLEHVLRHYAATDTVLRYDRLLAREVFVQLYKSEGTDVSEETGEQLIAAVNYHTNRLDLPSWEIVKLADGTPLIEADLRAPLMSDVELQAKVDVVMRHKASGKVWLIDWKSTSNVIDTLLVPPRIEHDYQLLISRIVLQHAGIDPDFAALCHLRSQAPEPPPLVYEGKPRQRTSYSTDKLLCDWETYRNTLVERGEDPSNPAALKVRESLAHQVFVRWQVDITSDEGMTATLAEIMRAARRMRDIARQDVKPIRRLEQFSPRSGCSRCDYETWCRAALRNAGSIDLKLLGTDYLVREGSVLSGCEQYGPQFDASKAYVEFAAKHGRTLEPHQEFTP